MLVLCGEEAMKNKRKSAKADMDVGETVDLVGDAVGVGRTALHLYPEWFEAWMYSCGGCGR